MDECIFCKISQGKIPADRIYENNSFFSVLDVNPKVEGHSLIISKKHFGNILEMPTSMGTELIDCIKNTSLKLIDKYHAEGFNILNNNFEVAGQIVKHVHFHILPRKEKDEFELMA